MKLLFFLIIFSDIFACSQILENLYKYSKEEDILLNSEIESIALTSDYLTSIGHTFKGTSRNMLIHFKNGNKAIFKPESGKWAWSSLGEVGAYRASKALNINKVPPTVIREIEGETGSLQYYIPNSYDPFGKGKLRARELRSNVSEKDWNELHVLHFIEGQWDNHDGNIMITDDLKLFGIDNEIIKDHNMTKYGSPSFIRHGRVGTTYNQNETKDFPYDEVISLDNVSRSRFRILFSDIVRQKKLNKLYDKFRKKMIRNPSVNFQYILWKDYLWVQIPDRNRVSKATYIPEQLHRLLRDVTFKEMKEVHGEGYNDEHIFEKMDRVRQLLDYH